MSVPDMSFDEDEDPRVDAPSTAADANGGPNAEDAMEDDVPDYKLFASMFSKKGVSGKVIRKGEKDFESHGTQAQEKTLEASRKALEDVLSYTRIHRLDAWLRAWYFPDWWITHPVKGDGGERQDALLGERVVVMEHERGNWMRDMGRVVSGSKEQPGVGRLWLLPEEALYLIERGTVDIWWPDASFEELLPAVTADRDRDRGDPEKGAFGPDDYRVGLPLSLEAAYSLLVGWEGQRGKTTLPKFQVYSHLKRAGFHVMRAPPASTGSRAGDAESVSPSSSSSKTTLWQWLISLVTPTTPRQHDQRPPFGPLVSPGVYRAYRPIYHQLALVPRHEPSSASPPTDPLPPQQQEPFRIHFHVWKPGGAPFSKKNPPPPDFRIAVADTADSGVPTLEQVTALLASTPLHPPSEAWQGPGKLYQRLKHGHRNVLVAVVERGLVNFMRFGDAAFGDELLYERFDQRAGGRGGKNGSRRGGRGRGRGRGRARDGRG